MPSEQRNCKEREESQSTCMENGHGLAAAGIRLAQYASLSSDEVQAVGGKTKVLIVDDEPESLHHAAEVFRSGGFDALTASSGSQALELLGSDPSIGMLFTDVLMGGMDGVTLGRKARELVPGVKVVLVSLLPTLAMEAHAGEPGEFSFLMKPFFMSEVELVLRM